MMKFRVTVLITVLMCAMALSSVVFAQTKAEAKGFWVEQTHIDLDPIPAGTDAIVTYVFHNDTDKEVKIIKAKPS